MIRQRTSNSSPMPQSTSSNTGPAASPTGKRAPRPGLQSLPRRPADRSADEVQRALADAEAADLRSVDSASFAYRKKRMEQRAAKAAAAVRSSVVPNELAMDENAVDEDDASCVSGFSAGTASSKSSKGSRSSAASCVSKTGQRRPLHVQPKKGAARHPFYLLRSRRSTEEIKFSGGMGPDECEKFYHLRKWDYVVEKVQVQTPQKSPPAPAASKKSCSAAAGMSTAKRSMIERLRKMGHDQYARHPQEISVPKRKDSSCAIDEESNSTLSTIGLDESLGSLDASQHSAAGFAAAAPLIEGKAAADKSGRQQQPPRQRRRARFVASFDPSVTVHRIPSATSYPAPIFESIWYTKSEWNIQKRASRLELMADGADWRTATEEGEYVQCPKTGRAVHPVHVKGLSEGRRIALGSSPMKLLVTAPAKTKATGSLAKADAKKGAMAA